MTSCKHNTHTCTHTHTHTHTTHTHTHTHTEHIYTVPQFAWTNPAVKSSICPVNLPNWKILVPREFQPLTSSSLEVH